MCWLIVSAVYINPKSMSKLEEGSVCACHCGVDIRNGITLRVFAVFALLTCMVVTTYFSAQVLLQAKEELKLRKFVLSVLRQRLDQLKMERQQYFRSKSGPFSSNSGPLRSNSGPFVEPLRKQRLIPAETYRMGVDR